MIKLPIVVMGVISSIAVRTLVIMTLMPLIGSDFRALKALPSSEIIVAVMQVKRLANATIANVTPGKNERISSRVNGNSSTEEMKELAASSNLKQSNPTAIMKNTSPMAVFMSKTGVLKYLFNSFLTMVMVWLCLG